jgi:hypothetical protein
VPANSAGVLVAMSKPLSERALRTFGVFTAFTSAAFMRCVNASVILGGARNPSQLDGMAYPRTVSPMVGISGRLRERAASIMPSTLMRPLSMCGAAVESVANRTWICPASRSVIAGFPPRYGTWIMSTPACALNNSPAR